MDPGDKGLVIKARNFPPVVFGVPELGLEYPHETSTRVSRRMNTRAAFAFKPETPKRMRDGELDAKRWIITEQKLWYLLWGARRYRPNPLDHQGRGGTQGADR